jgi:signal peptidase I
MKKGSRKKRILIVSIVAAGFIIPILFALFIRTFIIEAYKMPSASMKPTLLVGDHFLVNKVAKNSDSIERGDIIVFAFPPDPRKDFVKRVIGLPGEVIEIKDKELYVNESLFNEDYIIHTDPQIIPAGIRPRDNFGPIQIPKNSVFVLGDNRDESFDSRFRGFVDLDKVNGKVTKIYWSWDKKNSQVRWDRIGQKVH